MNQNINNPHPPEDLCRIPHCDPDPLFAVFNGDKEITEAMYKEVLDFAAYVKAKESEK